MRIDMVPGLNRGGLHSSGLNNHLIATGIYNSLGNLTVPGSGIEGELKAGGSATETQTVVNIFIFMFALPSRNLAAFTLSGNFCSSF
jgi:hypothetical protein